jgi:hypothetical protein
MMAFDYFNFFQDLEVRDVFLAQLFFPVLQTTLQDCEEQHHVWRGAWRSTSLNFSSFNEAISYLNRALRWAHVCACALVFDVVLDVRMGFVPFMEIVCISPLGVAR